MRRRGYLQASRTRRRIATSSRRTIPTKSARRRGRSRRRPCYDRMKALGAVFGSVYGWERPGWFAPKGYGLSDARARQDGRSPQPQSRAARRRRQSARRSWSFRRSNYFAHVGNECRNVFDNVGLLDMSAFAKCYVSGPGAEAWLDSLLANRIPKKVGRMGLCHLLTQNGGVRSEFTVYRTGPQRFYLVSAGAFERHDHDYLVQAAAGGRQRADPEDHDADGACWCSPVRARASSCRSSPTPTFRMQPSRGSPGSRSMSASPRPMRCASISSASSAGSCIIRSRCRTTIFDLVMDAGKAMGIKPVRHQGDGFAEAREILPAHPARAVDRIFGARIRARPLRAPEQGRVHRPRCAGEVAAAGVQEQVRHHGGARHHRCRRARQRSPL